MLATLPLFAAACGLRASSPPTPAASLTASTPLPPAAHTLPPPRVVTATDPPPPTPTPTPTTEPDQTPIPTAVAPPAALQPTDYRLSLLVGGLRHPTYLTHAGDGSGRLFVVEQPGSIRIVRDGALLPEPFLSIEGAVGSRALEQGLFSVAFHPNYAANGFFFVNYTDNNGDSVIARYSVSADPDAADPDSGVLLMSVEQPYVNHNGGQLQFGPDGYLYIGLGDGGSAGDPQGNGQNLGTLLGSLLRIDPRLPGADADAGSTPQGLSAYGLPPDNPFVGRADARPEIWAYGLRNPWRFSFDRLTGDLYIADVGQGGYEEIDFQPASSRGGENYGWNIMEGNHRYAAGAAAGLVPPVAEYSHAEGGCSVTGGYVYRGAALPVLNGAYLFGDFCSGLIWALQPTGPDGWQRQLLFRSGLQISSFGEDQDGELYVLDWAGAAYRLQSREN